MKRLVSIGLCLLLCIGLLGCQPKKEETSKADEPGKVEQKEADKSKDSQEPGEEIVTVSGPGQFPIVDKKISLTVFAPRPASIEDLETNTFTKHLEDLTNIHIDWQTVPEQGLKEKRNVLLASGDYPDLFIGASITQEEEMLYGSQGVFMPLNGYIEEFGKEIKNQFGQIDWLEKVITAPDGNIYTLPQINECYHCTLSQKLWINEEWLGTLGLDMPTTTEEFKDTLIAFRDNDPNGNGAKDEIPLTGAIKSWHTELPDYLMSAFIYCDGNSDSYRARLVGNTIEIIADKPEFKQGLAYLNDLYKEGLIDPSAFTQSREQLKQVGENPEAVVIGAATSGWFGMFTSLGGERHKSYTALPPLKGPEGTQLTAYYPFGYSNGQFAITSTNQYPEASLRMADYLFSEEGTRLQCEGREGIDWRVAEEGEVGINGKPAKWQRTVTWGEIQNFCWTGLTGPAAITSDYRLSEVAAADPYSAEGFETRLFAETSKYEGFAPEKVIPPLYMRPDQITEMAQLKMPITDYIKESMARFIIGDLDLESDWDSYVEGLYDLGAERYIELLQEAYDASVFSKD